MRRAKIEAPSRIDSLSRSIIILYVALILAFSGNELKTHAAEIRHWRVKTSADVDFRTQIRRFVRVAAEGQRTCEVALQMRGVWGQAARKAASADPRMAANSRRGVYCRFGSSL
jgi:hypothetical protein